MGSSTYILNYFQKKDWELLFCFQLASWDSYFLKENHQIISMDTDMCITKSESKLDLRHQ